MKIKIMLLVVLLIGTVLISACVQTPDCASVCKDIPVSNVAPSITQEDLDNGWYYGQLDQKKPGTPDNWIHTGEGTRSAKWLAPTEDSLRNCDCNQ